MMSDAGWVPGKPNISTHGLSFAPSGDSLFVLEHMTKPEWHEIKVKLGDLKPWAANPRYSTKAQAKRLIASFEKFGQVQTVAVSPMLDVYDGHQRLSALLTIHGADYEIDARQCDRALTDDERQELVITLHEGAVGTWNFDALANWDAPKLIEWGLNGDAMGEWKKDIAAVSALVASETATDDFDLGALPQEDRAPFRQMTFTLHDTQAEQIEQALKAAKALGPFVDSPNENSNGNALARICETFITEHGNG
jgi:hypothetical protein